MIVHNVLSIDVIIIQTNLRLGIASIVSGAAGSTLSIFIGLRVTGGGSRDRSFAAIASSAGMKLLRFAGWTAPTSPAL